MPQLKSLGVTAGINTTATIGHLDENLANSLNNRGSSWSILNGLGLRVLLLCPPIRGCWTTSAACYVALAKARPDFLWVDDDARMESHGPVRSPASADAAWRRVSGETGKRWSGQSLVAALQSGERPQRLALRRHAAGWPTTGPI